MAHNERIDQILGEQRKQGKNYADWQKEHYPVKASHTESRDYMLSKLEKQGGK